MAHILIVDDEEKICKLLAAELSDAGHKATFETNPVQAEQFAAGSPPDILITDLRMDGMDGIELLKRVRATSPGTDVVVMTAYASVETAIATMREGAYDYIIKPFQTEELLMMVSRLEERRNLQTENRDLKSIVSGPMDQDIIGASDSIMRVKELIAGLSKSHAAVLIRGESGTGKELVARAIHRTSSRSGGPFIALNCAAIPESLLESELFGYERGAFTGANRRKLGHFQLADKGTLFLDEIGDLPASLQAKLLRVLENKRITPLGSVNDVQIDIRLVSATHRPLESEIAEGTFRQDLFYRLNVFPIALPPLRDRIADIRDLAHHFLRDFGRDPAALSNEAVAKLSVYNWPGNIRELRNVLERATIIRPSGEIGAGDILLGDAVAGSPASPSGGPITLNLADAEKEIITRALDAASGNKSEAARLLGITRRALYGRLERYEME